MVGNKAGGLATLFTFDGLVESQRGGWKELSAFVVPIYRECLREDWEKHVADYVADERDWNNVLYGQIRESIGAEYLIRKDVRQHVSEEEREAALDMICAFDKAYLQTRKSPEKRARWGSAIVEALQTSETAFEVYGKLRPLAPRLLPKKRIAACQEALDWPISPGHKVTAGLAWTALQHPGKRVEVFWRLVAQELQELSEELLAIRERVRRAIPLADKQLEFLDEYLHCGTLGIRWQWIGNKGQWVLFLSPVPQHWSVPRIGRSLTTYAEEIAIGLIASASFEVSREFEDLFGEPMALIRCAAPSCGKEFYSRRADQRTCSSSSSNGRASPCKKEWDRYCYWLHKIGRDPERCVRDPELQRRFLKYQAAATVDRRVLSSSG